MTCGSRGGGQGRGRTADLPLFRRTLVPTELPAPLRRPVTRASDVDEDTWPRREGHIGHDRPVRPAAGGGRRSCGRVTSRDRGQPAPPPDGRDPGRCAARRPGVRSRGRTGAAPAAGPGELPRLVDGPAGRLRPRLPHDHLRLPRHRGHPGGGVRRGLVDRPVRHGCALRARRARRAHGVRLRHVDGGTGRADAGLERPAPGGAAGCSPAPLREAPSRTSGAARCVGHSHSRTRVRACARCST